jgi:sensor histidine kinase YesM
VYWLIDRVWFTRARWMAALVAHVSLAAAIIVTSMILRGVAEVLSGATDATIGESIGRELTSQQGQFSGMVGLFNYVLVAGAMTIIRLARQRRLEKQRAAALALRASQLETEVSRAQLAALEMQLNPHFLFNALNSIASLVQQNRSDDAYRAIALLGELLRETIAAGDRAEIPLGEELEFVERYLALEQLRFSDRLRISIDVDPELRGALVPAMVLQPLVENSIRHAVATRSATTRIGISAARRDSRICLEVQDDGPGLPPGWSLRDGAGVGLDNVRRRLSVHYGDAFELSVEDQRPGGVVARIALPLQPEQR